MHLRADLLFSGVPDEKSAAVVAFYSALQSRLSAKLQYELLPETSCMIITASHETHGVSVVIPFDAPHLTQPEYVSGMAKRIANKLGELVFLLPKGGGKPVK